MTTQQNAIVYDFIAERVKRQQARTSQPIHRSVAEIEHQNKLNEFLDEIFASDHACTDV